MAILEEEESVTMDQGGIELDPVSNVPIKRLIDAPIPVGGVDNWLKTGRDLKFELNPVDNSGIAYISSNPNVDKSKKCFPEESKLYPFQLTDSMNDNSDEFFNFLKNCFKNFEELIKNKDYHNFLGQNKEVQFGVIIEEDIETKNARLEERQLILNGIMSRLSSDLDNLINQKSLKIEEQQDSEASHNLAQLVDIMHITNLIHAIYFSKPSEKIGLLTIWINKIEIEPSVEVLKEIMSFEKPYKNPLLWNYYIKKLVSRGLFQQAINTLKESKFEELEQNENDLFLVIEDLISILNSYQTQFGTENFEFIEWKQKCCEFRDNFVNVKVKETENLVIKDNIHELLVIMTGLQSAIIKNSTSWYECFVTKYLFELPSETLISQYLYTSLENFPINETVSDTWSQCCLDLIKGNYLNLIRKIENLDKSIVAYLSILLEAKGLYGDYDFILSMQEEFDNLGLNEAKESQTISELLLNDHALECLCHRDLTPVGIGILMCLNSAKSRLIISQYLPHYECKTNDDLEWCMSICAKLSLGSTASSVLKVNASKLFTQGNLFESLVLFAKSGDLKVLKDKCWLILENSLVKNASVKDDLINSLILSDKKFQDIDFPANLRQCLAPYALFLLFLQKKNKKIIKRENQDYYNKSLVSQEDFIKIIELIENFEDNFVDLIKQFKKKNPVNLTQKEKNLIIQFDDCQSLYEFAVCDETLSKISNSEKDWRLILLETLNDQHKKFPETLEELILLYRKCINRELSYAFLQQK
ncbi:hypothetical protein PACTADRAFT_48909 [Pachysolen tannophilus NRRL Y-2460]|uniref:Nuclear pore complex protein Nup85 n=1 Tax=Pachysolen tannophilus NRRL Y-2460 TaxID=669874 RepID=A0A1E4TZJ3_PACTA|nr:hypothetical protein PACTADRAFT_48909 [Pachysolen tannophilus NRRL Y-2460]